MDLADEVFVISEDLIDGLAGIQVVAAGAEEDGPWGIRNNDPVRELRRIGDLRATKATIDRLVLRVILGQRLPADDRRGADE